MYSSFHASLFHLLILELPRTFSAKACTDPSECRAVVIILHTGPIHQVSIAWDFRNKTAILWVFALSQGLQHRRWSRCAKQLDPLAAHVLSSSGNTLLHVSQFPFELDSAAGLELPVEVSLNQRKSGRTWCSSEVKNIAEDHIRRCPLCGLGPRQHLQ